MEIGLHLVKPTGLKGSSACALGSYVGADVETCLLFRRELCSCYIFCDCCLAVHAVRPQEIQYYLKN